MGMSLCCAHELKLTLSLRVEGVACSSIFKKAERWLLAKSNHQESLQYVASKKTMNKYRSMIDFLFCEIFTGFRDVCQSFYENDGPPVREILLTQVERDFYEHIMLVALGRAYARWKRQQRNSWKSFRSEVLQLVMSGRNAA